jgi:hypothetical protein
LDVFRTAAHDLGPHNDQEGRPMGLNRSKRTDQHLATLIWLQSRRAAKANEAMAADAKKEHPSPLRTGKA